MNTTKSNRELSTTVVRPRELGQSAGGSSRNLRPRALFPMLLLALAINGCAEMSGEGFTYTEQAVTSTLPSTPGGHPLAFDASNGDQRSYILYLPPNYDPNRADPYSLYVMFHGGGQSAQSFALRPGMAELKTLIDARENEIVVFPNSRLGTNVAATNRWYPYVLGNGRDDVSFAFELMDHLVAGLNVDETEVFAAGYSNGGRFVHELTALEPNRFRAAADVAGFLRNIITGEAPLAPAGTLLPFLMVHGDNDGTVPINGGGFGGFSSFDESWDRWLDNNGCNIGSYTIYLSGSEYTTTACQFGTFRNIVRQQTVYGHGHSWPVWADGMSASTTMVQFFDQQL